MESSKDQLGFPEPGQYDGDGGMPPQQIVDEAYSKVKGMPTDKALDLLVRQFGNPINRQQRRAQVRRLRKML